MTVNVDLQIFGIKEALKEINTFDKRLRQQITKDYEQIVQPAITDATHTINQIGQAPMSGWNRRWRPNDRRVLPWNTNTAAKLVKAKINTAKVKQYAGRDLNLAVFSLQLTGAANSIFAVAGRNSNGKTPQGAIMIQVLRERFGAPSRVLWPAYMKNQREIEANMGQLVKKIMAIVDKNVMTQTGNKIS